jgi:hypothetical protein
MQFAAATAAKGTHLPISGGAVCDQRHLMYTAMRNTRITKYRLNQLSIYFLWAE